MDPTKASRPREGLVANPKLKLLDQVSEVMRFKHNSLRTEQAYRQWIKRFMLFHRVAPHPGPLQSSIPHPASGHPLPSDGRGTGRGEARGTWRHPRDMGAVEIRSFLNDLAVRQGVAVATQNQALNADRKS